MQLIVLRGKSEAAPGGEPVEENEGVIITTGPLDDGEEAQV